MKSSRYKSSVHFKTDSVTFALVFVANAETFIKAGMKVSKYASVLFYKKKNVRNVSFIIK